MPNIVKLISGSSAEELHTQLTHMAQEVQNNKTVSTKLQASKWDGRFWRVLTNFLAKMHIKLERTNATHVAGELKNFISKNEATLFNEAYYVDNLKNLNLIFERVFSVDPSSKENPKNLKYTNLFLECLALATKIGPPTRKSEDTDTSVKTGDETIDESSESEGGIDWSATDDSSDTSEVEDEEIEVELSEHDRGFAEPLFLMKYEGALEQLNKNGYVTENVKEFLLVLYDGEKHISECAEELRGINGLTAQLAETVEKLALNITKNERYRTDEEIESSHKTRLRHIMTILSVLPFDEHVEKIIGKVKQHPSVLLHGIKASLEVENKSFFENLKNELRGESYKGYWEIILEMQPKVSEDWNIEQGDLEWSTSIAGNVQGSLIKQRQTALHLFAKQEFSDYTQQLAEKLLQQKPDLLNFVEGIRTHTPLLEAVNADNEKMVEWLLLKNPDLRCRNDQGKNALKIAIDNGNTKLVGMLIKADPSRETWIDAGLIKSLESNEMAEDVIRRFN
ncbi:ankyrin repeat domain-containing protein [Parachlamydia acanthamoebae]|uniref:ankyrin repeat domain-containing protein n=1 Tax=Parachlamydia acanthamoebae TaxID=83552 RepID=UPI0007516322|nr:ankyrin repeat domain-containing protein [Parachlamydia acanthamoebae]